MRPTLLALVLLLAACSPATTAAVQTDLANAKPAINAVTCDTAALDKVGAAVAGAVPSPDAAAVSLGLGLAGAANQAGCDATAPVPTPAAPAPAAAK